MEEVKGGTDGHASSPQTHVASSATEQFSQDLSSLLASVFSAIVGGELKCWVFFKALCTRNRTHFGATSCNAHKIYNSVSLCIVACAILSQHHFA